MKNQFGTDVISQYDYQNDELARREYLTTSGLAFEPPEPNPLADMTEAYTTNELNQYTEISQQSAGGSPQDVNLSYDLDGNLTNDETFQYAYDAENRLISATPLNPQNGDKKTEYAYDYMSRRIQKQVYEWQTDHWSLNTEYGHVYDGWNLIKEQTTEGGSTTTDYYVWGLDLSGSLQGAGGIGGLLSKTNSLTSKIYLYTFDANGNVGQLVDAADGSIAAHYKYDPFGKVLIATGPEADNNVFRFSTKYYDTEIELYYYGYRYYDLVLGRWQTRDPIGEKGGLNLYGFVENRVINTIDPYGLFFKSEIGERVFYSCNCGWVDTVHLEDARGRVWSIIWEGIIDYEKSDGKTNIIDELLLPQPCMFTYLTGQVQLGYKGKKTPEQKIQLALNIAFTFETLFELHQSGLAAGVFSGFAPEDLPSDFLGFMEAAGEIPRGWQDLCKPLDKEQSLRVFEAGSFYNLPRRNKSHKPQLDDYKNFIAPLLGECDPCRGKDTEMPKIFNKWTPETWNYQDYGWASLESHFGYAELGSGFWSCLWGKIVN